MSATSDDAIFEHLGQPLKFDSPELDVPDPTEDIADEITSELAGVQARAPAHAPDDGAASLDGSESEPPPTLGSVLRDRYVLEAQIGGGGTATVFRALDRRRDDATAGGSRVAVKLLRPERRGDPRSVARLQREFRQTQAVAHPGVVRFIDLDCDRGSWFIVMELLAGESLAAALRRAAPAGLPRRQALTVAAAIADALAQAHARGVVHGDVKPANVFLTDAGDARLLDFGVAPETGDLPEPVTATRAYASPEVQDGAPAGARDDVFSLACVACESLAGSHPFGRGGARAARGAGAPPRRPDGLDDATWQLLARALQGNRAQRPDMDELARALRAAADSGRTPLPVALVPATAPERQPAVIAAPPARGLRVAGSAVTGAALALVLGILIGRLDNDSGSAAAGASVPVTAAPTLPETASAATMTADAVVASAPAVVAPEVATNNADAASSPPRGQVSFDMPAMTVSNRAVVAAIPLRHAANGGAARDARVNWRIIEGSARPGQDFGGPETGVETFAAGHTFRILYVPLVANPATTRDRTFVVELTGASPGVEIGETPRVAVTILGDR